jgi:hypothetical protein
MSQLINPLQALIDAAAHTKPVASITQTLARHQARQTGNPQSRYVLADVSGSMNESAGSLSKIEVLKNALFNSGIDWQITKLVAFSHAVADCPTPLDLPAPHGSTALHRALAHIAPKQPAYTLVISDGRPDDAAAALAAVDALTGVVDVLYVGPDDDRTALAFMQQLARRTGGKVVVNDLRREPARLTTHLRGLLPG